MARPTDRRRTKDTRIRGGKKKVCSFCKDHVDWIDYKDTATLRRFMSDRGKIRSRRVTGNCAQHQRDIQVAIKTARELALLPYLQRTASDRGLGRPKAVPSQDDGPDFQDVAGENDAQDYEADPVHSYEAVASELETSGKP